MRGDERRGHERESENTKGERHRKPPVNSSSTIAAFRPLVDRALRPVQINLVTGLYFLWITQILLLQQVVATGLNFRTLAHWGSVVVRSRT
jgi:hypothetical protein